MAGDDMSLPLLANGLGDVEQEQRLSGNGDREGIVVGAGLCDGEGERVYTVYDLVLCGERLVWCS